MLGLGLGIDSTAVLRSAAGSPYSEIGNLGFLTDAGSNAANPSADFKYGNVITVPVGGIWVKRMFMSFFSGASGAVMRPVLYSGSGVSTDPLFQQGEVFTCPSTFSSVLTELGPMPWQASGAAIFLPAGNYVMGILIGTAGMGIRSAGGGTLLRTSDTYSDGAAATFGTITSFGASMMMRLPYSLLGP